MIIHSLFLFIGFKFEQKIDLTIGYRHGLCSNLSTDVPEWEIHFDTKVFRYRTILSCNSWKYHLKDFFSFISVEKNFEIMTWNILDKIISIGFPLETDQKSLVFWWIDIFMKFFNNYYQLFDHRSRVFLSRF